MKHLFFPNLKPFLSKPIGNLTVQFNCHQPDFWSWFFLTITLCRRKNPKEIHFKPGFRVGWQTFAPGKVHRVDRIFWYDQNGIKGRIGYKGNGYNRMKKAWVVKQWCLPGQTRKRLVLSLRYRGCFDLSKFRCCDVRYVSLLPFSEYDWPKGSGIRNRRSCYCWVGKPFYKRKKSIEITQIYAKKTKAKIKKDM